jgi:hypothetical protein
VLEQVLDSIKQISTENLSAALCRFALAYTKQFVLIPDWWESLQPKERRAAQLLNFSGVYTDYFKGPFTWVVDSPHFF